jgi:hypothetical protein
LPVNNIMPSAGEPEELRRSAIWGVSGRVGSLSMSGL